jgi:mannose-6-phosphate isomerase-like protein (cupin superfamily)
MIETIVYQQKILAILVSHLFGKPGAHFFTPDEFSQQLGYMNYPIGKVIEPHIHNPVTREVEYTQEVLFIRKGRLRVDFYGNEQQYVESRVLEAGDVILLASGGHGFEVLEDIELFEVKQGPFTGDSDRTRFEGIVSNQAKILNPVRSNGTYSSQ